MDTTNKLIALSILWILLSLGSSQLFAQDFEADMKKMQEAYTNASSMTIEMTNKLYRGGIVKEEQKAKVHKSKDRYLYDFDQYWILLTKEDVLMVDERGKTIVCNKWTAERAEQLAQKYSPNLEGIQKKYPSIKYLGKEGGYKKYRLENENIDMAKVEISFEESTGYMREIRYYYHPDMVNQATYIEVIIDKIHKKSNIDSSRFLNSKYIQKVGNKTTGVGTYKHYTIHNVQ